MKFKKVDTYRYLFLFIYILSILAIVTSIFSFLFLNKTSINMAFYIIIAISVFIFVLIFLGLPVFSIFFRKSGYFMKEIDEIDYNNIKSVTLKCLELQDLSYQSSKKEPNKIQRFFLNVPISQYFVKYAQPTDFIKTNKNISIEFYYNESTNRIRIIIGQKTPNNKTQFDTFKNCLEKEIK